MLTFLVITRTLNEYNILLMIFFYFIPYLQFIIVTGHSNNFRSNTNYSHYFFALYEKLILD